MSSMKYQSPEAAFVLAGMSSWMSVAATLRGNGSADDDDEELQKTCGELNQTLANRAFLCGETVGQPTLADLDVFFALVERRMVAGGLEGYTNLKRFMRACAVCVVRLVKGAGGKKEGLPEVEVEQDVLDGLGVGRVQSTPEFVYPGAVPVFVAAATTVAVAGGAAPTSATTPPATSATPAPTTAAPAAPAISDEQKKIANEKRAAKKAQKDANRAKAAAAAKDSKSTDNNKKSTPAAAEGPTISALDIRIGKILSAIPHDASEKLYISQVDVGEDSGPRQILSGLRAFYSLEEMNSQGHVLVLCNLKKRNLVGVPSHGMVLCASSADHTGVEFVVPPTTGGGAEPKVGERVLFEGFEEGDPEPENKVAKKKMFEKLAPDFRTDGEGVVVWKGAKSKTAGGACVAAKGRTGAMVA